MPSVCQQHDIALRDQPALEVIVIVVVKVHPYLTRLDEKHLLRVVHFPNRRVVHMRFYDVTFRATHIAELLRKVVRRKEADSFLTIVSSKDQGQHHIPVANLLNHWTQSSMR